VALRALNGKQEEVFASTKSETSRATEDITQEDQPLNPTDSYSARNVNPEYEARSNAEIAKTDDENYFSPDYHYQTRSDLNSWNNNFSSQYDNSWYQNSYWTPGMYSWNSRYYGGGFYDPWSNIWYSPYTRPGWNSSISFSCGNAWNSGYGNSWSMNYGYGYGNYGYGYGNPYNSYWYNPYSNWGGGYPQYVVVERNNGPRAYGKRNSRSTSVVRPVAGNGGNGGRPVIGSTSGRSETGSRLTSNTSRRTETLRRTETSRPQQQPEHYNRSWRNQSQPTTTSSENSLSNTNRSERSTPTRNTSRSSGWNSGSSNNNNSSSSSPSYTPSRNSGSSGSSGNSGGSYSPSRSSGSNNSSSGSNSRSSAAAGTGFRR
jgi:hypothetical protein